MNKGDFPNWVATIKDKVILILFRKTMSQTITFNGPFQLFSLVSTKEIEIPLKLYLYDPRRIYLHNKHNTSFTSLQNVFYFISICLQRSWCLKSWLCSVPLPFLIKVSDSCRFLWVLSLIHIYLQNVLLDLVFLIDLFLWQKVCPKPSILNGSIEVIYFFSIDKTKVHRELYLHHSRSTCLQKHVNFSSWFSFFHSGEIIFL